MNILVSLVCFKKRMYMHYYNFGQLDVLNHNAEAVEVFQWVRSRIQQLNQSDRSGTNDHDIKLNIIS